MGPLDNIKICKEIRNLTNNSHYFAVRFRVVNDDFASFLENLLQPENGEFIHSPMFVFADPFGYGGKCTMKDVFIIPVRFDWS